MNKPSFSSNKFWSKKKILVTGGAGFLGKNLVAELKKRGAKDIFVPRSKSMDLRNPQNCQKAVKGKDIVIHLAGIVGGIGFNQKNPGKIYHDNILMGTNLMEAARSAKVNKFVAIGTVCCYPKFTPVPFSENNLWNGYPEETNAPYGLAKKMLLVQGQAYRQQYGFNAIFLLPVNLYGPGDKFDPEVSHVIPALIKKVFDAKEKGDKEIVVWGTGKATREFLYVEDAARAIADAAEKYNKPDPVNIGAGFEISIKKLVSLLCELLDYKGKIIWDKSKPDGQPRRCLNVLRSQQEFGFTAKTSFKTGLTRTIRWYQKERLSKRPI